MIKTFIEIENELIGYKENIFSKNFNFTGKDIVFDMIISKIKNDNGFLYCSTIKKDTNVLFYGESSNKKNLLENLFNEMKKLKFKENKSFIINNTDNMEMNLELPKTNDEQLLFDMQELVLELRTTNSSNEKLEILNKNTSEEIKVLFEKTYNPLLKYWVRLENILKYEENKLNKDDFKSIESIGIFSTLDTLEKREKTGYDAILAILKLIDDNKNYKELILNIINKDLKIGLGISTLNKNYGKGFIKETPYMGAVSYNKKKVDKLFLSGKEVYSDLKMDGRYANAKITKEDVYLESRSGNETNLSNSFDFLQKMYSIFDKEIVLNGELIIPGIDRYTSNGIIGSIVIIGNKQTEGKDASKDIGKFIEKNNMTLEEAISKIVYVVWDYIPLADYESTATYSVKRSERLKILKEKVKQLGHKQLQIIETKLVKSSEEAMKHFQELVEKGEEGTILKSADGTWKDGKPAWQIKFKVEDYHDLKITGFNYGKIGTKNEKLISSVNVETSDGLLKTSPGGIKEDMMKHITKNQDKLMGTIIEVKCSGLSQDRDGNYSLLHPVFVKLRDDKTEPASLQKCIEVNSSNNELS